MRDKVAIFPTTQNDFYPLMGMTERQVCEDMAYHMKSQLIMMGIEAEVFIGTTRGNSDGARRALAWGMTHGYSIHCDSCNTSNATLMCYGNDKDLPYALDLLERLCAKLGTKSRGVQKRGAPNGIHPWPDVLTIPDNAGKLACLVEVLNMSNPADAALLASPYYRQEAGLAQGKVMAEHLGVVEEEEDEVKFDFLGTKEDVIDGEKMLVDVYGATVKKPNATLMFYENIEGNTPVEVFFMPVNGVKLQQTWGIGGYNNSKDQHGTMMALATLFGVEEIPAGFVTIHVPAGNVKCIGEVF